MENKYAAWIRDNYPTREDALMACSNATERMVVAFPELTRVRGHYHDLLWGPREHWWCTTPEGEVVDPTVAQFPDGGAGRYESLPDDAPEPIGRCLNCGDYCWEGKPGASSSFCSEECCDAVSADLMG
jgi:hypothetical protein